MSRYCRSLFFFLLCLHMPQAAWATFWLEAFDGKPEDFRLIRDGQEFAVIKGTALKTGDEINVLNPGKKILLKDDFDNSPLPITKQHGSFTVPAPRPRPDSIDNALALLGEKISDFLSYKTKKSELSVRESRLPVLILGASNINNYLLAGTDTLTLHWIDGEPPYRVQLLDKDKNIIAENTGIRDTRTTLTGIHLPAGEYTLKVSGETTSHPLPLTVIEPASAPDLYHAIMASDMQHIYKQRYAATALAGKREWLLQALQLAEQADWQSFGDRILDGKMPELIDDK